MSVKLVTGGELVSGIRQTISSMVEPVPSVERYIESLTHLPAQSDPTSDTVTLESRPSKEVPKSTTADEMQFGFDSTPAPNSIEGIIMVVAAANTEPMARTVAADKLNLCGAADFKKFLSQSVFA
jgi:hypothetical protein